MMDRTYKLELLVGNYEWGHFFTEGKELNLTDVDLHIEYDFFASCASKNVNYLIFCDFSMCYVGSMDR